MRFAPIGPFDMTNTLFEPLRDNSSFVSFVLLCF